MKFRTMNNKTIEKPVSTEVGDNEEQTSDQNNEDSASNVQKGKSVPPAAIQIKMVLVPTAMLRTVL